MYISNFSTDKRFDASIQEGLRLISAKIGDIKDVPHLIVQGVCPSSFPTLLYEGTYDNRLLKYPNVPFWDQTPHCTYTKETPIIVLPKFYDPQSPEWDLHVFVHEFGHTLHAQLKHEDFKLPNITHYAKNDRWEQFAECFTWWILGDKRYWAERNWNKLDGVNNDVSTLFNSLFSKSK